MVLYIFCNFLIFQRALNQANAIIIRHFICDFLLYIDHLVALGVQPLHNILELVRGLSIFINYLLSGHPLKSVIFLDVNIISRNIIIAFGIKFYIAKALLVVYLTYLHSHVDLVVWSCIILYRYLVSAVDAV